MAKFQVKYPVYVPSKGRADVASTMKTFDKSGVDYRVVVEPQEVQAYSAWASRLLVLPENDRGLVFARNWIKDHATAEGHARHWQFDDDIMAFMRAYRGNKLYMQAAPALALAETFVDRYENVALASFNSEFFLPLVRGRNTASQRWPPFYLNSRCYTCFLVLNALPNRWRRRYNEDTDMSLQVLADGWCTILFNAFLIKMPRTMTQHGGQSDTMYAGDGRTRMARQLESMWPGTVTTYRRFGRAQHLVRSQWKHFDTPLKLKPGVVLPTGSDEHGLALKVVKPVTDPYLKTLVQEKDPS